MRLGHKRCGLPGSFPCGCHLWPRAPFLLVPAVLHISMTQVTVASVEDDLTVVCSRQVRLVADKSIKDCAGDWDLIALPVSGGG